MRKHSIKPTRAAKASDNLNYALKCRAFTFGAVQKCDAQMSYLFAISIYTHHKVENALLNFLCMSK